MGDDLNLRLHLQNWSQGNIERDSIAKVIMAIGKASIELGRKIARSKCEKPLDQIADEIFAVNLADAPIGFIASPTNKIEFMTKNNGSGIGVLINPLEGSSNIVANGPFGSIFSILPAENGDDNKSAWLSQPGSNQLAAGFILYGPKTILILSLGEGTMKFVLDPDISQFLLDLTKMTIPSDNREYAINASNYCHWDKPVRAYVEDCNCNNELPNEGKYNMRWSDCVAAEAFRILVSGGIYLNPGDDREGFRHGHLQLLFEANPIALLIEQAGGLASNGMEEILSISPDSLDQYVPLVFGSPKSVERVVDYHTNRQSMISQSPLFTRRGLFRA